jgi:hypothetical protein
MNSPRLSRVESYKQRRTLLQLQCALQREQFLLHQAQLSQGMQSVNRGFSLVRGSRIMPILMTAVSAASVLSRAGGVVRLLGRAWMIVGTLQRLRRSLK